MAEKEIKKIDLGMPVKDAPKPIVHKTLRQGRLDDIPYLIEFGRKIYNGSPMEFMALDEKKAVAKLEEALIASPAQQIVLISHVDDVPVGTLVAYAFEPVFSSEKIAVEVLWYLDEEYRKGRRGIEMMEAYEYWAKMVGCSVVQYGWLVSSPVNMPKLYERTGAELSEQVYYKRLK